MRYFCTRSSVATRAIVQLDDHPIERVEQVLTIRIRARCISARADAGLRHVADTRVLMIRPVPEFDRIRRGESRFGKGFGMEMPLADVHRVIGANRPER